MFHHVGLLISIIRWLILDVMLTKYAIYYLHWLLGLPAIWVAVMFSNAQPMKTSLYCHSNLILVVIPPFSLVLVTCSSLPLLPRQSSFPLMFHPLLSQLFPLLSSPRLSLVPNPHLSTLYSSTAVYTSTLLARTEHQSNLTIWKQLSSVLRSTCNRGHIQTHQASAHTHSHTLTLTLTKHQRNLVFHSTLRV